jgi:DNA anti-recombination protein RmuC
MFKEKIKTMKETLDKFERRMEKIIQEILEEEKRKNEKLEEELKKYGDQLKIKL